MKFFELGKHTISIVVEKIKQAEKYVRVAIFQLHNRDVFDALNSKLAEGVKVEIFTLPLDSINEVLKAEVVPQFETVEKNGARLYLCRWNVGDPGRTTTAVDRWYSYHGKFIVTDKSAISLSANLTHEEELDALIIYENDAAKIREYNERFDELIELFIAKKDRYDGSIRRRILGTGLPDVVSVFELPPVIKTDRHKDHWIQHYPGVLCPKNVHIADKLYFTPFDCRGRDFIESIVSEAAEFAYMSVETFTDDEFCDFLIGKRLQGLDVRIICGYKSRDFTDRIQNMFRELLANNIGVKTSSGDDIHAKLIVTDKHVAITSVNFNEISLGWAVPNQDYWREDTETISICSYQEILENAKSKYLKVFNDALDMEVKLREKVEKKVSAILRRRFNLGSKRETKELFSRLIVREEIKTKKAIMKVAGIVAKYMAYHNRRTVEKEDFLSALILYYLSERKHAYKELDEKLKALEPEAKVDHLLDELMSSKLVEKEEDYYKIRLESLL